LTTGQDLHYAFHNTFITSFQIKDFAQYLKHMVLLVLWRYY